MTQPQEGPSFTKCDACEVPAVYEVRVRSERADQYKANLCKPHAQASYDVKGVNSPGVREATKRFEDLTPPASRTPETDRVKREMCDPDRTNWHARRLGRHNDGGDGDLGLEWERRPQPPPDRPPPGRTR